MFQTRCKYFKHLANVSNALRTFKTRCKCLNALLIFKRVFRCFKRVANIQNTLLMFQTPCEHSKKFIDKKIIKKMNKKAKSNDLHLHFTCITTTVQAALVLCMQNLYFTHGASTLHTALLLYLQNFYFAGRSFNSKTIQLQPSLSLQKTLLSRQTDLVYIATTNKRNTGWN